MRAGAFGMGCGQCEAAVVDPEGEVEAPADGVAEVEAPAEAEAEAEAEGEADADGEADGLAVGPKSSYIPLAACTWASVATLPALANEKAAGAKPPTSSLAEATLATGWPSPPISTAL